MTTEKLILENLIFNPEYFKKVLNFIDKEYFKTDSQKHIFSLIYAHINKYNTRPTVEILNLELHNISSINEIEFNECCSILSELNHEEINEKFLLDQTEKWIKDRALFNAIRESIQIIENKESNTDVLPELIRNALSVSLDNSIGHEYLNDWENRYDLYHKVETKIPTDLEYLNKITNGGFSNKTLNIFMGGTGGGKTLIKCHLAASILKQGYNVLYITMEMAEEKIAERIDANLLDCNLDDLMKADKSFFDKGINKIKTLSNGRLFIKEYPTGCANVSNFKYLLRELEINKTFVPNIIFIDYLNICSSHQLKVHAKANSYLYIKTIAEEIRSLAVDFNVPIITSTQLNREGFSSSDPDLTNTSESFGLAATVDLSIAIISTDELKKNSQYLFKQLKNRYKDESIFNKFLIGYDKAKMRLFDVNITGQNTILQPQVSKPVNNQHDKYAKFII